MGETPSDGPDGGEGRRNRWSRLPSGVPTPDPDDADGAPPLPLDGDVLLYTGATASVSPERIEPVLREAQAYFRDRRASYRRDYESAFVDGERRIVLVPTGHWEAVGADLGLPEREVDAARRAHAQQLRRIGSKTDSREEFETALEIREAVVIGE